MPDERTPLAHYYDPTGADPDKFYQSKVAAIDGFVFDWARYRIPESTYVRTDITQWLALEVAHRALQDAGYTRESVPKDRTGVFIGNTCTGEQMRSNTLRLRWPVVYRALMAAGEARGISHEALGPLLSETEAHFKSIFPDITEDFAAGSISATIAGRICNYFDLHGGGFVIDGACASSLATVNTAANLLSTGELDLALAGGVDVALDPFELVGFCRNHALSKTEIRPYDRRGDGFVAGEGCGVVVLKRLDDARRDGDVIYAIVRGWGLSSDGRSGIMQPVAGQQAVAIGRAMEGAGYQLDALDFIEGHGTGTRAGDRTEIEALSLAMAASERPDGAAQPGRRTCGIGSIKSQIGHTKAAAGVASLIKAVTAVNRRVIPPTASCEEWNDVFDTVGTRLFPIGHGELRDPQAVMRAGVSAFGFGGINVHLTLESGSPPSPKLAPAIEERALLVSHQQNELFVFGAHTKEQLAARVQEALREASRLSQGDLVDLAAALSSALPSAPSVRAAVIAATPDDLATKLEALREGIDQQFPEPDKIWSNARRDVLIANARRGERVGFLFPGQGSQQLAMCRALLGRFDWARSLADEAERAVSRRTGSSLLEAIYRPLDQTRDAVEIDAWKAHLARTDLAQPAICLASVLYLRFLESVGIRPSVVGGHSLGELTALHAAGAFNAANLFALASLRGRLMNAPSDRPGAMASLDCSRAEAMSLVADSAGVVVIANVNAPNQIVVSGDVAAVEAVMTLAASRDILSRPLAVSNAFHSPLVARAAEIFEAEAELPDSLPDLPIQIISSVESARFEPQAKLRKHLARQIVSPVDFIRLATELQRECDLVIEVGPGRVLSNLCRQIFDRDVCTPIAADATNWNPNPAIAMAFLHGIDVDWSMVYAQRLARTFVRPSERVFIGSPAEAPLATSTTTGVTHATHPAAGDAVLERTLASALDLDGDQIAAYLRRRGTFLAGVARLDMESLGAAGGDAAVSIVSPARGRSRAAAAEHVGGNGTSAPRSSESIDDILLDLASKRTGYPRASITADSRLLDDLNLDSIKAGEMVAEALRHIGAAGAIDPTRFANASLRDIAIALRGAMTTQPSPSEMPASTSAGSAQSGSHGQSKLSFVTRIPSWTRNFLVGTEPKPVLDRGIGSKRPEDDWAAAVVLVLFEPRDRAPAEALTANIVSRGGRVEMMSFTEARSAGLGRQVRFSHQLAVLPRTPSEERPQARLAEMLARVTAVAQAPAAQLTARPRTTIGYVQFGGGLFGAEPATGAPELGGALSFARTLHMERNDLRVRVLDFAASIDPETIARLSLDELTGEAAFEAVGFDPSLTRRVPVAVLSEPATYRPRGTEWTERDVILVTGGAKGIMAECALGIARTTGATLVLVGRGAPEPTNGSSRTEIARTMDRFAAERLSYRYFQCDIADPQAVAALVEQVEATVGPITGVVHGASILKPCRIDAVTVEGMLEEVSPKVLGAWNLCHSLEAKPLKLFVAISSLVVDHGMPWSGGYGFANEMMERVVQQYGARWPFQIISFGMWDNIGRPAVLKSNDHLLSIGLHDGEISPEEGVRRFVELFESDPGSRRICVYGRSVGYKTWDHLRPTAAAPAAGRFIEQILHLEPSVEVVARCRLTLERDRFLRDHFYNSMYIVPTVLAIEALAQAAVVVVGHAVPVCRLDTVEMPFPIVVDPDAGLEIEIRAEVQEQTADGETRVNVSIRTAQTDFKTDAVTGTVVFGPRRAGAQQPVALGTPLAIDPKEDLYGRQFFVGPLYQRMGPIFDVDPDHTICLGEIHSARDAAQEAFVGGGELVLGDPFFRDTLLHTSFLHHLKHLAFTASIAKIELFEGNEAIATERRVCSTALQWSSGKDAEFEFVASSLDGHVRERWSGFHSRALGFDRQAEWPSTAELLDLASLAARDERALSDACGRRTRELRVQAPKVALDCILDFSKLPREQRHEHERSLVARALGSEGDTATVSWSPTGRPRLAGTAKLDVSFSHEGPYCLCVASPGLAGCDLASISPRTEVEWRSLLGSARTSLLSSLCADDPLDLAGSRIWAAIETARKATEIEEVELRVLERRDDAVLFHGQCAAQEVLILTFPVRLSRGAPKLVALTVSRPEIAAVTVSDLPSTTRIVRDEALGCDVLEYQFPVGWRECATLSRKAMFPHFVDWFQRTREQMLSVDESRRLVAGVLEGTDALVARSMRLQFDGEVTAHDEMCVRVWVVALSENTHAWRAQFSKRMPGGARVPVGTFDGHGGVVQLAGVGRLSPVLSSALDNYRRFVQTRPSGSQPEPRMGFAGLERGAQIFALPSGSQRGPRIFTETLRPSLVDSDLVGNVSSTAFFIWQAHVRDRFLNSVIPTNMVRRIGPSLADLDEALCSDVEMTFLREVFPFDEISIEMSLRGATERGADLRCDFFRKTGEGVLEKLAVGEQRFVWVRRRADGEIVSQPLPSKLRMLLEAPKQHDEPLRRV